jgi:cytochrome c peroxidase
MKRTSLIITTMAAAGIYLIASCGQQKTNEQTATPTEAAVDLTKLPEADQQLIKSGNQAFGILPVSADNPKNATNADKVALGKMLYHDPRLSKSGFISCNSCHNLASYGVDNLPTSIGHKWNIGERNAPTVLNAAFHIAQFWDGRAADVEEQAKGPILNPGEMALPHEDFTVERIKSITQYQELFAKAFPGETTPLTYENIAKAIAAFERTLITPSRFDEYLKGKADALTEQEKRGMQTFMNTGCTTCHMGATVGGNMYQKFGVTKNYWELTGSKKKDEGRSVVTKNDGEKYFFKVPSLRNITRTYPYFHDGSVWDLYQAISIMAELQLGKKLSENEVADIAAFLEALTGTTPADALTLPVLPASTAATSKPAFN